MNEPILLTDHISMEFGGLWLFQIFPEVYPGEIVGLIGPNGAGKTTVFNMITEYTDPLTAGYSLWAGYYRNESRSDYCPGIARTFQNIRLFDSMTV